MGRAAEPSDPLEALALLFKAHPWHGIDAGPEAPAVITAYIEIVPSDTVKYEVDKATGHLKVDRAQKYSNVCPTLYGFVPRTYCGERVAALSAERTGSATVRGDGDPLDICVLTEKVFTRGDFILRATPIGGLRLIDRDEADDKIIAVMAGDAAFGHYTDVSQLPAAHVERLRHYFLTYKQAPDEPGPPQVAVAAVYGSDEARRVIELSLEDYAALYPDLRARALAAFRD